MRSLTLILSEAEIENILLSIRDRIIYLEEGPEGNQPFIDELVKLMNKVQERLEAARVV